MNAPITLFFRERDANREVVNYEEAVNGRLQLVPKGSAIDVLATDYRAMVDDGLMFGDAPTFDSLIDSCQSIQDRANAAAKK